MSIVRPTATGAALDALLAAQSPSGAFGSVVDLPTGPVADENGFVTALVLHELAAWPATPALTAARMRALDFLTCCERPDRRGAFSFYPPDRQPEWMPIALLPDADDTALFTLALVDAGRWPAQRLTHAARQVLESFRLRWLAGNAKPWHREGVYLTWLDELVYPNIVDLCVNINVAALLKRAGPEHAGALAAIVDMVDAGLTWAGASPQRAFLLTPYYPHPAELGHAIDRAIRLGVTELLPCRDKLRDLGWSYAADPAGWPLNTPLCSSDDGRIVWRAPLLQQARQLLSSRSQASRDGFPLSLPVT